MLAIVKPRTASAGDFCWLDLAATNAATARQFYNGMFGWTSHEQTVNGGGIIRLQRDGRDVGSLYQLSGRLREYGVPSHWLPYVRVKNVDAAARRALANGGRIVVRPFAIDGVARIVLILDPVGAQIGLWEPLANDGSPADHG